MKNDRVAQAAVFALFVTIGVAGRWGQPDWCVTPLAAISLLAGCTLPLAAAVAVPLVAMAITDLALAPYDGWAVPIAVYAAMAAPALMGRLLRRPAGSHVAGAARLATLAAAPSALFFITTNLAVWASSSLYPATPAGLAECYAAAVPFLRRMLVGDLAWTAVTFAAAAAAGVYSLRAGATTSGQQRTAAA
ncbi:DUF6580 family putative transport protein [Botrimarina sp.]|uniref:DUF6580 family putative transport protein n=1 Tax=Botrimarina sp. TaxID=2795802 RepID=UPI0032EBD455